MVTANKQASTICKIHCAVLGPFWLSEPNESKTAASRRPYYVEPVFDGLEFEAYEADQRIYHGGCHCGAVTLSLRSKPLSEVEITECNCGFCWRVSFRPRSLLVPIKKGVRSVANRVLLESTRSMLSVKGGFARSRY